MMTIERVHINKAPGVRVFRIFMPCRGQTGEYKTNVFPEIRSIPLKSRHRRTYNGTVGQDRPHQLSWQARSSTAIRTATPFST